MNRELLQKWLQEYAEAWRTYEPEKIRNLFSEIALSSTVHSTNRRIYAGVRRSWLTGSNSLIQFSRGKRSMRR